MMEFPSTLPRRLDLAGRRDDADRVERVGFKRFHLRRSLGPRTRCAALAVSSLAATFLILASACYAMGRRLPPADRFFDPRESPTVDDAGLAIAADYALSSADVNDVVFVGDSACHDGIDPARLPFRSFNLGTQQGAGPIGTLILLRLYLAHHKVPRMVVLCASPFCFEAPPGATGHPERFVANYGPEVAGLVSPLEAAAYFARRGALDFGKPSGDFRSLPLVGFERHTFRSLASEMESSRGFFALPGDHGVDRPIDMPGPSERVNPDWDTGIRSIVETCRTAGVPLLIRFAPIRESERSARDWSQLDRWASSLSVAVANPTVVAYPSAQMFDAIHLNSAGVKKFMPIVAADVQAALGK